MPRARAGDCGDHQARGTIAKSRGAGSVEPRTGLQRSLGEQVLEQISPDLLAGARKLLLRLEIDLVVRDRERGFPQHSLADIKCVHELGHQDSLHAPGRVRADEQQVLARDVALRAETLEARAEMGQDVRANVGAQLLVGGRDTPAPPRRSSQSLRRRGRPSAAQAPRAARRSRGPVSHPSALSAPDCT